MQFILRPWYTMQLCCIRQSYTQLQICATHFMQYLTLLHRLSFPYIHVWVVSLASLPWGLSYHCCIDIYHHRINSSWMKHPFKMAILSNSWYWKGVVSVHSLSCPPVPIPVPSWWTRRRKRCSLNSRLSLHPPPTTATTAEHWPLLNAEIPASLT